jgi:Flp pilus assembly protein TadD
LASTSDAALQRGLRAAREGNCTAALIDLAAVISANPRFIPAYEAIGICETKMGRPDRAAASFQQIVNLKPGDWQAWNNLGSSLIAANQPARAAGVSKSRGAQRTKRISVV